MQKVKKVIKFKDLPENDVKVLYEKYPDGWEDFVRKITKPNGDYFYAINLEPPFLEISIPDFL